MAKQPKKEKHGKKKTPAYESPRLTREGNLRYIATMGPGSMPK